MRGRIPAYVLSKLEPEARRELEAHLRECKVCSEMVAVCREIASVLRDGGEDLFGRHPAPLTLREYALDGEAARDSEVARHVASCAECGLDVAVWKARQQGEPGFMTEKRGALAPAPRRRLRLLALAAGVLLGIGLTLALRSFLSSAAPTPPPGPDGPRRMASSSGPALLMVLGSPLRGRSDVPSFRVAAGQPYVLVAVQPVLPPGATGTDLYRFEIRSGDQEVWHADLPASRIREQMEASGVTTFMVPATRLPPGQYDLRLLPPPAQSGRPLLDLPFAIIP
jgi:anti-sigma factor RsiW